MDAVVENATNNPLEHLGVRKGEVLKAYHATLARLRTPYQNGVILPAEHVAEMAKRMARVIATPDLASAIWHDPSRAFFVHSTDSETAGRILKTGLYAGSITGILDTASWLEPIRDGMTLDRRQATLSTNLEILASLAGRGISGDAKVIIELPPPPEFGLEGEAKETEYDFATWTTQYVRAQAPQATRRYGVVSDAALPPNYIRGCIDFKNNHFVRNSSFKPDALRLKPPHSLGERWKRWVGKIRIPAPVK